MLEYFKTILSKVSFDRKLFEKELKKAIKFVLKDDLIELKRWCYDNFGQQYGNVIEQHNLTVQLDFKLDLKIMQFLEKELRKIRNKIFPNKNCKYELSRICLREIASDRHQSGRNAIIASRPRRSFC